MTPDLTITLKSIEPVANSISSAPLQGQEIDPTLAAEFAKQVNRPQEVSQVANTEAKSNVNYSPVNVLQENSEKHQAKIGAINQNFAAALDKNGQMNKTAILENQSSLSEISNTTLLPPLKGAEKSTIDPSLLGILQSTSDKYQAKVGKVKQNLATAFEKGGEMSGATILENQVLLAEASALAAYFSKVAGSLTNAINTIVKTQ